MTPLNEDKVTGYLTDLAKSQPLDLLQHAANVAIISSALAGIMGFKRKGNSQYVLGRSYARYRKTIYFNLYLG